MAWKPPPRRVGAADRFIAEYLGEDVQDYAPLREVLHEQMAQDLDLN